jgi:hypothetical protein
MTPPAYTDGIMHPPFLFAARTSLRASHEREVNRVPALDSGCPRLIQMLGNDQLSAFSLSATGLKGTMRP